ncbi:MAG: hypothetical protein DWQ07_04855 [Chloroflexi bacterium]|nr:MAG: hypothetical protein DWQ07_04855 [Chloroflexota bacterium]MBL1194761.1 hypothetical protein [Chloroflexota bacterium]NOH12053.1 NTP transferase domain-containing protein [Chloroflexota bacterium]
MCYPLPTVEAILLTGGVPKPGKPLYQYSQGHPKASLKLTGTSLVQRSLSALDASEHIKRIVIVGPELGLELRAEKPLAFVPHQGSMMDNLLGGMRFIQQTNPSTKHYFLCSSDLPLIQAHMLDWIITKCLVDTADIYYPLVTRKSMEAHFPEMERGYVAFKDTEVTGAAMGVVTARTLEIDMKFWQSLEATRKSIWRQAALFGYSNLLGMLFRRFTLQEAVDRVVYKLGIVGRILMSPHPEIAYDVDVNADWEYLLERQVQFGMVSKD